MSRQHDVVGATPQSTVVWQQWVTKEGTTYVWTTWMKLSWRCDACCLQSSHTLHASSADRLFVWVVGPTKYYYLIFLYIFIYTWMRSDSCPSDFALRLYRYPGTEPFTVLLS